MPSWLPYNCQNYKYVQVKQSKEYNDNNDNKDYAVEAACSLKKDPQNSDWIFLFSFFLPNFIQAYFLSDAKLCE